MIDIFKLERLQEKLEEEGNSSPSIKDIRRILQWRIEKRQAYNYKNALEAARLEAAQKAKNK